MHEPLRVVLALESSGPGGAENVVLRLAAELRARGDTVVIATLRPGWMTERAEADGFEVWVEPQRPGIDLPWIWRFARRLRAVRAQVLHTHEFAMNVFGGTAALLARVPTLATVHGRHWVADRPARARAYRLLRRLGMPIVPVSEDLAGFLETRLHLRPEDLHVVHNGVPVPDEPPHRDGERASARDALGLPPGLPLLVAVGNLYPVKDHASLLRALPLLPPCRVAIAGRGEEEDRLRSLARELEVSDRVHLLGLRDDVDRVLAAADVFVQPSLSEGLPLALLEAMAAGLPVVATRVGGMPAAIVEGKTGHLVPPGEPEALARALRGVLEAGDRGAALGLAGWERARAEFSVSAMATRYREAYGRLIRR